MKYFQISRRILNFNTSIYNQNLPALLGDISKSQDAQDLLGHHFSQLPTPNGANMVGFIWHHFLKLPTTNVA